MNDRARISPEIVTRIGNFLRGFGDLLKFDNRLQLLVNRLLFRNSTLVVYRLQQNEILIDHGGDDQNGTRACLVSDMYSRYFHLLPKENALNVLDLGANGGGLPLSMHCHGIRFARLGCVEMNPATFGRLHFNISRNIPALSTSLINAAVCESDGKMTVNLGREGQTKASIRRVSPLESRPGRSPRAASTPWPENALGTRKSTSARWTSKEPSMK